MSLHYLFLMIISCMLLARSVRSSVLPHIRTATKVTVPSVGSSVLIISTGESGSIASVSGGWLSVNVNNSIKKVRRKDIQFIVDKTSQELLSTARPENNVKIVDAALDTNTGLDALEMKESLQLDAHGCFKLNVIDPPATHTTVEHWVIFSDLHVKSASIEICEEVLDRVHAEAVERQAGIIFLGDFWHVRGALSVDLLNRILSRLSKWKQPVIMIPGNHDQVTLGGAVHALEPLRYAFRADQILMISEPVVCMGALWVPYRRDHSLLRSILAAGATDPQVGIVFCHADVKGASMNDGMKSREGLDINTFPPHMPIFSGHYHKPHTMVGTKSSLHYVGSPYQTSLSEANEKKYLNCLECKLDPVTARYSWVESLKWQIDIGPKYFKVRSPSDKIFEKVKAGDKVVLSIEEGVNVLDLVTAMSAKKVELELREDKPSLNTKLLSDGSTEDGDADVVQLDPRRAFMDFMKVNASDTPDQSGISVQESALKQAIISEGLETIDRLRSSVAATSGRVIDGSSSFNLTLDRVELQSFGPFGGKVSYPLSKRGLVLIRGKSNDGTGADSNGAGKTTLAMSVLWALTGTMDTRLVNDGKAADVAYDAIIRRKDGSVDKSKSREAEVKLTGAINGHSFEIMRRRSTKKSELSFKIGDVDLTQQSTKDTQARIDERLGVGDGLLQRCCFFGQHSHTMQALLGLTDVKLKNELSLLADMSLWVAAVTDLKAREKAAKLRASEIVVELRIRDEELRKEMAAIATLSALISKQESDAAVLHSAIQNISADSNTTIDSTRSADAMALRITELEAEASEYRASVLEVTKTEAQTADKVDMKASYEFDKILSPLQQSMSNIEDMLQTSMAALTRANKTRIEKRALMDTKKREIGAVLQALRKCTPVEDESVLALTRLLPSLKDAVQTETMRLAECDIRTSTTKEALLKLKKFHELCGHSRTQTLNADDSPSCPTCGQSLEVDSAAARNATLTALLATYQDEKAVLTTACSAARSACDSLQSAIVLVNSLDALNAESATRDAEYAAAAEVVEKRKQELRSLAEQITLKRAAQAADVAQRSIAKVERDMGVRAAEDRLRSMLQVISSLKADIIPLRKAEFEVAALLAAKRQECAVLEERISANKATESIKLSNKVTIESAAKGLAEERDTLHRKCAVLDNTAQMMGVKGVQHFIFMSLIKVLETIANLYLQALADGGVQLVLSEDEEGDKVVKGVTIRGADGEFRSRGLSQLSGGQWRRVSLALDLAFAEVIRRRGILRCNLIVMDEILTHLDASGREAVGSVLRALVQGPRSLTDESTANNGDLVFDKLLGVGAYETVMVILQDLAAQELEEAFDHIDTVVKEADSSTIILDGQ